MNLISTGLGLLFGVLLIIVYEKVDWKKIHHYIFKCPTFWQWKRAFKCPICGKRYRCYWNGNDVTNWGKDICDKCYKKIEAGELNLADYFADLEDAQKTTKEVGNVVEVHKCCPVCGVNFAREVDFKLMYWDGHDVSKWSDDICQICYDKIIAGKLPLN